MYPVDGPCPGSILSSFESRLPFLFGVICDVFGNIRNMGGRLGKSGLGIGAAAPKQVESQPVCHPPPHSLSPGGSQGSNLLLATLVSKRERGETTDCFQERILEILVSFLKG